MNKLGQIFKAAKIKFHTPEYLFGYPFESCLVKQNLENAFQKEQRPACPSYLHPIQIRGFF